MRVLGADGFDVTGLDILPSPHTTVVGSVADRDCVRRCVEGVDAVIHAATLHKPHVGTHSREEFVAANVTGTLNLLEEAVAAGAGAFVFTSTTSAFGRALTPAPGAPAAWITEDVAPLPRNIYGATKTAAEDLCELVHRDHGLPCLILRTSRFFPEPDDRDDVRAAYDDANLKVNELLYRRVDIEDVVSAHRLALERAGEIGFGRYIVSATTPFSRADLAELRADAPAVVRRLRAGLRGALRAARLADVRKHRARVRERARPRRAGLGAALRLRPRARAAARGGGSPQPAGAGGGRQGLPRRVDRALHGALSGGVSQASGRLVADGFHVVAVGVEHEGAVVVGVVDSRTPGPPLSVAPASSAAAWKASDHLAVACGERHMHGR